jgi:hypothetical protein
VRSARLAYNYLGPQVVAKLSLQSNYCKAAQFIPAAAAPLWSVNYTNPAAGIVAVSRTDVGQACGTYVDFAGKIGIVGTPVIDTVSQTMYFVVRTKENGTFVQRLHAIDIRSGGEKPAGKRVSMKNRSPPVEAAVALIVNSPPNRVGT